MCVASKSKLFKNVITRQNWAATECARQQIGVTSSTSMASTAGGRWPSLVVFDLDDCVWSPEMYTLSAVPSAADAVRGDLGNGKESSACAQAAK